jgi:putative SOS response-associated peptidase YedK
MPRMCGRFAQPRSSDELARIFRAREVAELAGERFNVAPTDEVAAVVEHHGDRQLDVFRWGLVPVYSETPRQAARLINARAETVETSPAYRASFRRWRCLVPADAFYEWRRPTVVGVERPRRGRTEPFAVRRRDGEPLALAGLWAVWREPATAARLYTCTIVTTVANDALAPIHPRMPVLIEPDDWDRWLDETTPVEELRGLLRPADDRLLDAYPVSSAVNDVRRNGPELLDPVGPAAAAETLGL